MESSQNKTDSVPPRYLPFLEAGFWPGGAMPPFFMGGRGDMPPFWPVPWLPHLWPGPAKHQDRPISTSPSPEEQQQAPPFRTPSLSSSPVNGAARGAAGGFVDPIMALTSMEATQTDDIELEPTRSISSQTRASHYFEYINALKVEDYEEYQNLMQLISEPGPTKTNPFKLPEIAPTKITQEKLSLSTTSKTIRKTNPSTKVNRKKKLKPPDRESDLQAAGQPDSFDVLFYNTSEMEDDSEE